MSRILRPDAPLDMDTQARLLEQLLSVMSEAGVDVLEFGIHHLVQSKTSEVKKGNELTITLMKEKQCTICGEMKPLGDFYMQKKKRGKLQPKARCKQCELRVKRERYRRMHPLGVTYDLETGKAWRRTGMGRRIEWTSQMLSDLRRLFARTKNDELAGILGVGVRTMVRKARELGLEKDGEWLSGMWRDHVRMHMMSRALGYPGRIMPGEHRNPEGEFKAGSVHSQEERRKISEGNRRNWMLHKRERRAKIRRTRGLDDEEKTAFVS